MYSVSLPWLTLPPVFVHRQDRIAEEEKNVYLSKDFTRTNRIYTGMSVLPVTNSMSACALSCALTCALSCAQQTQACDCRTPRRTPLSEKPRPLFERPGPQREAVVSL